MRLALAAVALTPLLLAFGCAAAPPPPDPHNNKVKISMNFNSLCKQCQVHTAAVQDILLHAGAEMDHAGLAEVVDLSIDYYGGWPTYEPYTGTCEAHAVGLEHGPDRCVTDRYHLCAQHGDPASDYATQPGWFNYVQCMWMNIDTLKCHNNGFCAQRSSYFAALARVHPMCAASAGVNATAIKVCAESPRAVALQKASYLRANATLQHGFAPTYVNGKYMSEAPRWRFAVDMLAYGRKLLTTVCDILKAQHGGSNDPSALPVGCKGL